MKVVILAGGSDTRLADETEVKPKPMVEIGGRHTLAHHEAPGAPEWRIKEGAMETVTGNV